MNKLLRELELEIDNPHSSRVWNSPHNARITDESFIKAWQLADDLEDFDNKLDETVTAWRHERTKHFISYTKEAIAKLEEKGMVDGTEEKWGEPLHRARYGSYPDVSSVEHIFIHNDDVPRGEIPYRMTDDDGNDTLPRLTEFLSTTPPNKIIKQDYHEDGSYRWGRNERTPYTEFHILRDYCTVMSELREKLTELEDLLNEEYHYYNVNLTRTYNLHRERRERLEKSHRVSLKYLSHPPKKEDVSFAELAATYLQKYNEANTAAAPC